MLAAGTVIGAQSAQAAAGASWANACTTPLVFVAQGGGNDGTQFYTQQYTDTGGNFVQVGTNNLGVKYNSIGFDPQDNYVYGVGNIGVDTKESHLLKIDSTGTITDVGNLEYNGAAVGTNHGAFDPAGNFYVGGGSTIYKATAAQILGANNSTTVIPMQLLTTTGAVDGGSDFTYADGFLWSAGPDGTVWKTDLGSLVTTAYPNVVKQITDSKGVIGSAYGAAWTYGNDTLGFDANAGDNPTGLAVQTVNIAGGTPTFVRQVSGPGSGNNDGASCALPADLSITKTINGQVSTAAAPVTVQPGGAVTWVLGVTNTGPGGSSQQFVNDVIPAGVTAVSVAAANAQCSVNSGPLVACNTVHPTAGQTLTVQFGFLPSSGANTRAITITATAPPGVSTEFDNTAIVSGNEADPTPGNNTATAYAQTPSPSFTLSKSGIDTRTLTAENARPGDAIQYTFTVHNTSSVVLTGIAVTDPKAGGVVCDSTAISPDGQANNTTVCHANYVVTQADFDAGIIHNVATATAIAPGGATVNAGPATFDVTTDGTASAIKLTKTATPSTGAVVGTNVGYGFSVQNTGDVSLSAVTVTDPMFPAGITCALAAPLPPGQSVDCSGASHAVTQAEFDAGSLTNNAVANATAVRGAPPAPSPAQAVVTMAAPTTSIALTKTVVDDRTGTAAGAAAGDKLSYTFVVQNTGNVSLTSVSIADSLIGNTATCPAIPAAGIAPQQSITCTAPSSYTVTQGDVDAGSVVNNALASGTFVRGPAATAPGMAVAQTVVANNSVTLTKTVVNNRTGTTDGGVVGDKLSYTFVVTNTGNTSMTAVALTDTRLAAGAITCPAIPAAGIAPQQAVTCAAPSSYTITQADVDTGTIPNTASVTATFRRGDPATAQGSATATTVDAANAITLLKTATDDRTGTDTGAIVGDTISYGFHITNSGNVSLTAVQLTDTLLPAGSVVCPPIPGGLLAPTASIDCVAASAYTVTQDDVDNGTVVNTATVVGTFARGATATAQSSATVTAVAATTTVALAKTAVDDRTGSTADARVGDTISYGFVVTNTANVSLTSAQITDTLLPAGSIACPPIAGGKLAPGGTIDCSAPSAYTVTQADFDTGTIPNTATVAATFARGADATDQSTATVTAADPTPALELNKTAAVTPATRQEAALAGDTIAYTFDVTNTGDVSVATVAIDDADANVGTITCAALPDAGGTLAPGSSVTCTADVPHTITQAEFDAQVPLVNTAAATAVPLRGPSSVRSNDSQATVPLGAPILGLILAKDGTVTPAADQTGVKVGDTIKYTYTITNSGNVTMYDLVANDLHTGLGTVTCPATDLAGGHGLPPGGVLVCATGTDGYTVTQGDVDLGFVYNIATPIGTPPPALPQDRFEGTPGDDTILAEPAAPAITLQKTATVSPEGDQDGAFAGDTIAYSFLVTNTGNITVRDVQIDDLDANVGSITCPTVAAPGLAPGDSTTCTADRPHTVTQAEFDAQAPLVNTATASAQPLRGPAPITTLVSKISPAAAPPPPPLPARITSNMSSATVALGTPVGGLKIVKKATVSPAADKSGYKVGDKVTYTFTVTNTGNVTLHGITVHDPKIGAVTCPTVPDPGLAPKASIVCRADAPHVMTQADVDAGSYQNSATAGGVPPPTTHLVPVTSVPGTVTVPAEAADPKLSLVKKAVVFPASHQNAVRAGDHITYTFLVTNTGNVTLKGVGVDDPTGGPVTCPKTVLAPGQSMTCHTERVHVVTAGEVADGVSIVNRATAFGTPPQGLDVVHSGTSSATTGVEAPTPASNGTAFTGLDSAGLLGSGLLILLLGGLLLLIGLRRRPESD